MSISIIGAGQIGTAIFKSLKQNNNIALWDKVPGKVQNQKQLSEIIPGSDLVFLCVPSSALRNALEEIKIFLPLQCAVVSVTKGIESSGKFAHQAIAEVLESDNYAMLSGPMIAAELGAQKGGAGVVATKRPEIYENLKTVFDPSCLILSHSEDLYSVSLAGVLKNIYALLVGVSDGLGHGSNIRGILMTKILNEFGLLTMELKADPMVFAGPAGLGDLVATAFSENSMNHKAGMQLAARQRPDQSEGIVSLPQMAKLLKDLSKYPCLNAINSIVLGADPKQTFEKLIYEQ